MRAVRLHVALVAIASGAVTACTDVCACTPTPATALLIGRVIDDTGAPTAGATIVAYSAPAAGVRSPKPWIWGSLRTVGMGAFGSDWSRGASRDRCACLPLRSLRKPQRSLRTLTPPS